jgi:hypothetical protein
MSLLLTKRFIILKLLHDVSQLFAIVIDRKFSISVSYFHIHVIFFISVACIHVCSKYKQMIDNKFLNNVS